MDGRPDSVGPGGEETRSDRDALPMEASDSSAVTPGTGAGTGTRGTPSSPPRANMPLILTLSVPGLGHALYGAPAWGVAAVVLSLVLLLVCIYVFIVLLFRLIGGWPFLRPLVVLVALLAYGLAFTGLVVWDVRELEERDGRVTRAMHLAIASCALVILGGLWLIS